MSNLRTINKVITGVKATDGAGVNLVRVIGYNDVVDFDPFLMLDAFDSVNPDDYTKGFPWHPHRGIETITYLISGDIEHGDSLGNKGSILNGDCQWMTAGSGIIHQEMPKPSERMLGLQLWLNLPAQNKLCAPKYRDINHSIIPVIEEEASTIRIIGGEYKNITGGAKGEYVKPTILDVEIKGEGEWFFDTGEEVTLFIYIVRGSGHFSDDEDRIISEKHAILFNKGKTFCVKAGNDGIRFILFTGKPLKEPIAWGGPIVMNSQEELNQAFLEIDRGQFIK